MANTTEFSPAMPIPPVFDVQKRIQMLHGYLDPNNPEHQPEQQHLNIRTAIQLYEEGKIDGLHVVYIMDGKIVTREEIFRGTARAWVEVSLLF
jgi:hypothetical protein